MTMAYRKLTKAQRKDRDRVMAWLRGEEFRENSRAKPAIPALSADDVREMYVPPDVTGAGQFFTPVEMATALLAWPSFDWFNCDGMRILDPCAGIGNLVATLDPLVNRGAEIVCYELEQECAEIGARLCPWAEWRWEIPFDHVDELEGRFDFVVMNPPFNTTRGMYPGQEMSAGRCTKSEHVFLELALRALKPGGQAAVIAPYNYVDRFPKQFRAWVDARVEDIFDVGRLVGEFRMSSITVNGWLFTLPSDDDADESKEKFEPVDDLVVDGRVDAAGVRCGPLPSYVGGGATQLKMF